MPWSGRASGCRRHRCCLVLVSSLALSSLRAALPTSGGLAAGGGGAVDGCTAACHGGLVCAICAIFAMARKRETFQLFVK